jgi:hypothetical protein
MLRCTHRHEGPFPRRVAQPLSSCFILPASLLDSYISESFDGTKLHPVDVYSATDGRLAAQLVDGHMPTISPVNKAHPTR